MKKSEYNRAKSVEKIILLSWDSLSTHLHYTHLKTSEGEKFHKNAILDYIKIINEAVKLW